MPFCNPVHYIFYTNIKIKIISIIGLFISSVIVSVIKNISSSAELPPEKPIIKAEKGWYASGDSLRAQCSSPPADPPANLTWLLNGRDVSIVFLFAIII